MNGTFRRAPRQWAPSARARRLGPDPPACHMNGTRVLRAGELRGPVNSRLSRRLPAAAAVLMTASLLGCSAGTPGPQASASSEPQTVPTAPAAPWTGVWSDSFSGPAGNGGSYPANRCR